VAPNPSSPSPRTWFCRSVALTLAVGACLLALLALRPGYGVFFVASTLSFLVAGILWVPSDPPHGGRRLRRARRPMVLIAPLSLARSYRVTTTR